MPAGVSWGQYLKFLSAAMLSMMAGSQLVHMYYKPLDDLEDYIEKEMRHVKPIDESNGAGGGTVSNNNKIDLNS